jgi:hypothetical protein
VCALDLDVLAGTQRMLFDFLEQSTAPDTPHLLPSHLLRRIALMVTLPGSQKCGRPVVKNEVRGRDNLHLIACACPDHQSGYVRREYSEYGRFEFVASPRHGCHSFRRFVVAEWDDQLSKRRGARQQTKGPMRDGMGLYAQRASNRRPLRACYSIAITSRLGCSNRIIHHLAVRALDLDTFAWTQRMLLDFLEQTAAPHASHVGPTNRFRSIATTLTLLGRQKHGDLLSLKV